MKILTAAQLKELDRYTIEHEPIASIDLMERASICLTREIESRWNREHKFYIFAGAGNNGGDALAIARLLHNDGYKVRVWLFDIKNQLSPECETNLKRLQELQDSVEVNIVKQSFDFPSIHTNDVIIDGLFGTGLNKPLNGGFAHVVKKINATHAHIVALDVPSGLLCEDNTYCDRSQAIHAELTLTIQLPKFSFLMPENEICVGQWKTVDINLSGQYIEECPATWRLQERDEVSAMLRQRSIFAHKGTMGHALLVAGSAGMAGAAIMCAQSCLRSGVGKLTLHTPSTNAVPLQIAVPEAVLHLDPNSRYISESTETHRYQAIGIGPGIGRDAQTVQAIMEYIAMADIPMVLDADALNILAEHPDWMSHIPQGSILTPHVRELEGLVGHCTDSRERLDRAMDLATLRRVYVVVKGHYTAICTPAGRVIFNPTGNPGMATPGSGDVLTGILTGLLAQGYPPAEATLLGVWLHGSAGDFAAQELGPESMLATDITTHLHQAFASLKSNHR